VIILSNVNKLKEGNKMKKTFLTFGIAVLVGGFTLLPATQADARSNSKINWRDRVCASIEKSELRAWERFDQNKSWTVKGVQNRINLQERFRCAPDDTIVGQLVERSQFSTLATALTEAGLVDTFNGEGDFTVFAPTNQAFEKLGSATIQAVLADIPTLTNILAYHVVDPAVVSSSVNSDVAVTLSSATMLNGGSVDIEVRKGKLFINDSQVIVTDIKATNGIVHVIDTVLLP
jgi:uncharacterized surface protein with fasciclin (FAS1) repeats